MPKPSPAIELLTPGDRLRSLELTLTSLETGTTETLCVDTPLFVIGRGSQCDLRLTHPDVSRRHACIQLLRDRALCVDLGSRTGLHWQGVRRSSGWLEEVRPVRIGPFDLQLNTPGEFSTDVDSATLFRCLTVEDSTAEALPATTGLRFLNQPTETPPVSLKRPITLIGRADLCKLRLHDESVSRVHSSVMITADGVWIADLLGRGGVRVNGEFVSLHRLEPGDVVQIGRYRMVFATDLAGVDAQPDSSLRIASSATSSSTSSKPVANRTAGSGAVAASGAVSESLLLAVTETFADMQRQMSDQFRFQMEMMVGLIESMRHEMNGEVQRELAKLVSIGEEIRDTQRKIAVTGSEGSARGEHRLTEHMPSLRNGEAVPEAADSTEPVPSRRKPRRPLKANGGVKANDGVPVAESRYAEGVADHVFMTRRLRDLERERNSHWVRLVGLMKGDA